MRLESGRKRVPLSLAGAGSIDSGTGGSGGGRERRGDRLQIQHSPAQPQPGHQFEGVGHTLLVLKLHKPVALVVPRLAVKRNPHLGQRPGLQREEYNDDIIMQDIIWLHMVF